MSRTDIGDRVRQLRTDRGWTQGQVAAYASGEDDEIDRTWLSLLERGGIEEPGAAKIVAIARVLGVDAEYLVTGVSRSGGAVTIEGPVEKVAPLRRIARFPAALITRYERSMASLFDLNDHPGDDESQSEGDDQGDGDDPDSGPRDRR